VAVVTYSTARCCHVALIRAVLCHCVLHVNGRVFVAECLFTRFIRARHFVIALDNEMQWGRALTWALCCAVQVAVQSQVVLLFCKHEP